MSNALQEKKAGTVILVTAAQGGSGRTMTAAALATRLTQYGKVTLIADDVHDYFQLEGHPENLFRSPLFDSWTGERGSFFPRVNLNIVLMGTGDPELGQLVAHLRGTRDFVIVTGRCSSTCSQERDSAFGLGEIVDQAVVLYRHNARSYALTTQVLRDLNDAEVSLVLPVANFTATNWEVDRGSQWSQEAMRVFREPLAGAGKLCGNRTRVEQVYFDTAIPFCAYTSYGAVNAALQFGSTDAGRPAFAIHNIASILLESRKSLPAGGK
jgi:hypothetical protein